MQDHHERGSALVLVLFVLTVFLGFTAVTSETVHRQMLSSEEVNEHYRARMVAESGLAQALMKIREGGVMEPRSGGGVDPVWVQFDEGAFYYFTTWDAANSASVIRAWGRIPRSARAGGGSVSHGIELTVVSQKYLPPTPMYTGNGGIERPLGGFAWNSGSDPFDSSTWGIVSAGSESSWQGAGAPFRLSALDHPITYFQDVASGALDPLDAGQSMTAIPHSFPLWSSQNPIGQYNIEAWFKNSAVDGTDPTLSVEPAPSSAYDSDPESLSYPYPVDPNVPDVQSFADELWGNHNGTGTQLYNGSFSGTYGTIATPGITFVTGKLTVPAGTTFSGAGVLVIRDDFDPNVDTNNQPSVRAGLSIQGKFEWTGLVLIAGWAPSINASPGSDTTIVGALFGEDSVQSGGEISLDSSTITMVIEDDFRVLYSSDLFKHGGIVNDFLPYVLKKVVGARQIDYDTSSGSSIEEVVEADWLAAKTAS